MGFYETCKKKKKVLFLHICKYVMKEKIDTVDYTWSCSVMSISGHSRGIIVSTRIQLIQKNIHLCATLFYLINTKLKLKIRYNHTTMIYSCR